MGPFSSNWSADAYTKLRRRRRDRTVANRKPVEQKRFLTE